jgi:NAD(P)-dependent dehydrogenase (short-subunit alcohol dehydrogenase family)
VRYRLPTASLAPVRRLAIFAALVAGTLAALPSAAFAETVMITGANSGIGLEFTKQYIAKGWTIIATHRRSETPKTLADLAAKYDKLRIEKLDVTSVDQVHALAAKLANVPIDVLINNAGVYNDRKKCKPDDDYCAGDWSTSGFGKLDYDLWETIYKVNVKGNLLVAESFYNNVKASKLKKIAAISSSTGSLTGSPTETPGSIFYRSSKAALNKAMRIVAAATKADGVTVVMLNPGPTLTEHQMYLKDAKGMLQTDFTVGNMIRTIDKVTIADTGKFLRYDGVPEAW